MNNANLLSGWQEAVFCVADIDRWIAFWEQAASWKLLHRGPVDPAWFSAWGVMPPDASEEALLGQPGQPAGHVRLVSLNNQLQEQMRPGGQVWETGGWFDINVRVHDIASVKRAVQAHGWTSVADPVLMRMGQVQVKEWLARGPDGIVVAFIERISPPLSGFPDFPVVSRAFNSTQIVHNIERSRSWYERNFGFQVFVDTPGPGASGGANVYGLPHNLISDIPSHLLLMHPQGEPIGSIEFCSFSTISGRDFSLQTRMPYLGILSLRFPVTGLEKFADELRRNGTDIVWIAEPAERPMQPQGMRNCFIIAGPNGEWLEFFEQ